jgi:SIT family siderophore-iron:H+ symporter-like MFS transporter
MVASQNDDPVKGLDEDIKPVSLANKTTPLMGTKSPGVARIEALNAHTSLVNRCFIFFGLFIVAYAYGLDGTLRGTYQPYATAGFQEHSTLATISQTFQHMHFGLTC